MLREITLVGYLGCLVLGLVLQYTRLSALDSLRLTWVRIAGHLPL